MKVAYFLLSSFVVASITVGIATVNQFAPGVQFTAIARDFQIASWVASAFKPTSTASTPIRLASPAPTQPDLIPQPKPLSSRSPVTIYGIGGVRVGITLKQAEQAGSVSITPGEDAVDNGCSFARPKSIKNLLFMVQDGQIARVDVVRDSPIKTLSGAGIGNTEAEIKALHPNQIEVSPHEYVQGGHYLTYVPNHPRNSNYRMVFETNKNGIVTRFRAGRLPEVSRIEGCV